MIRGLGGGLFARAVTSAGSEPAQHVEFGIPTAACSGRAEIARPVASKAILVHSVGMDTEYLGNLVTRQWAALWGVGEQLAKLLKL